MKIFSTFSGIGGFEIGIHNAWLRSQDKGQAVQGTQARDSQGRSEQLHQYGDEGLSFAGYSEIDKYAIKVYEKQFPGVQNYGDITKINAEELPDFDCLVGGFPCQAFSIAGKRKGFEDTRGTLFFDLARILRAKQPRLFVFENVKGLLSSRTNVTFDAIIEVVYKETTENIWQTKYDKNWEIITDNLSAYLQKTGTISGLLKNSKSLLDQSLPIIKKQNYLVGEETQPFELKESEWDLLQSLSYSTDSSTTTDTSWLDAMVATNAETVSSLKNILEGVLAVKKSSTTSTDERMMTELKTCIYALQNQNITLFMLKQYMSSGSLWKKILSSSKKEGTYYVKTFNVIIDTITELGYDCQWQVLNSKDFGVPQNRERVYIVGHLRGTPRPEVFPIIGTDGEDTQPDKGRSAELFPTIRATHYKSGDNQPLIKQLNQPTHSNDRIYASDGISPTLNTMQGGNRQPKIVDDTYGTGLREYEDTVPTLRSNRYGLKVSDEVKIRRLTPMECERLQGFPDDWTKYGVENQVRDVSNMVEISDTQRYKMCGNAVTTNVVQAVFERIFDAPH